MAKRNIAVVAGGFSHEEVISMKSSTTIMKYLDQDKYTAYRVIIKGAEWNLEYDGKLYPVDKNDFTATVNGKKISFDGAYIIIHGSPGEDGVLPGYFEMLNIPYSTNKPLQGALTFNKYICNQYLKGFGVNVAGSMLLRKHDIVSSTEVIQQLGLPCFIKPNDGGSSFGVTKVKTKEEILPAIAHAFDHGTEVVMESFVKGIEISCGIVSLKGKITVFPITEIVPATEFFDFAAKYEGKSEEITPARIPDAVKEKVQSTTQLVYEKLGLRGLARIDYIIQDDVPYLIEVNTIPGMSEQSIIPQQARCLGWDLKFLITGVADEMFS